MSSPAATLEQTTFRTVINALEAEGRVHPPLVAVSPTASVKECLAVMARHHILSVPIRARSGGVGAVPHSRYAGMLSILDLVGQIFTAPDRQAALDAAVESALPLHESSRESYRIWDADVDDDMRLTLQQFTRGIHRALLTSVAGDPTRVFTQSDVLRYIAADLAAFLPAGVTPDTPLGALPLQSTFTSLISVRADTPARDAFLTLWQKNVQAVPVLDAAGRVVATVSGASLRGITSAAVAMLDLPVAEFLAARNDGTLPEVATCTKDTTFADVIQRIVRGSLHRVWVLAPATDDAGREVCTGVISLTDLIRWFLAQRE
ncbi:hypothetical protein H9P43_004203 [Blastocladiella emersonii ATCC 22665]|nr:hypothetical protein H9P43_004203 [Blastocladiella emersonii ATCC 22665]